MDTDTFVEGMRRAWNGGDLAAVLTLYAPDAQFTHPMAPGPVRGREAIAAVEGGLFAAFDEIAWEAGRVVREGDVISLEFRCAARHVRPLPTPAGDVPATNRRIVVEGVSVLGLDSEGRIARERRYFDTAAMLRQLGLM